MFKRSGLQNLSKFIGLVRKKNCSLTSNPVEYLQTTKTHWACNFVKKETPRQMFSCEYFEIFNSFPHRKSLLAASGNSGLPIFEISKKYIQDTIKHQAFCENHERLKASNCFRRKVPS